MQGHLPLPLCFCLPLFAGSFIELVLHPFDEIHGCLAERKQRIHLNRSTGDVFLAHLFFPLSLLPMHLVILLPPSSCDISPAVHIDCDGLNSSRVNYCNHWHINFLLQQSSLHAWQVTLTQRNQRLLDQVNVSRWKQEISIFSKLPSDSFLLSPSLASHSYWSPAHHVLHEMRDTWNCSWGVKCSHYLNSGDCGPLAMATSHSR